MEPVKVKVLSSLHHDQVAYPPGSEITIDTATAANLIKLGIVEQIPEPPPEPVKEETQKRRPRTTKDDD